MVSVFMRYLRAKGVDEKRLRIRMVIHVQDDEYECKRYWKGATRLEDCNFLPTIMKSPSFSRKPLPFGTVTIRYNSVELLRQINREISELVDRIP
jgi:hypothetical protein